MRKITAALLLQSAVDTVRQDIDPRLEAQTFMFLRVARQPGIAQISLAEQVGITPSAISRSVEKLVRLGLVSRYEDEHDRRNKRTVLTAKGDAAFNRLLEQLERGLEMAGFATT